MALVQHNKKSDDSIYVKFSPKSGQFVQTVAEGTPGSVARTTKATDKNPNGRLVHEVSYPGIQGQITGLTCKADEVYGGMGMNIAFKDPGEPTIIAGFSLQGESGVSREVVQLLQVIDMADLREMLRVGIGHKVDPIGSTYEDKGVTITRTKERSNNNFFVAPLAGDKDSWFRADFTAIPKVTPITDKAGKVVAKDEADLEAYAIALVERIQGKLEAIRLADKEALAAAPSAAAGAEFGVGEVAVESAAPAPK